MSSPKARRRQRSTRLVTAAALVVIAAVVVLGAVLSTSLPFVSAAAVLAVALGAAAARITHSELVATRREAAADRARQAEGYRALAEERSAEHREFATAMQTRVGKAERAVTQLESAVVASQGRADSLTAITMLSGVEQLLSSTAPGAQPITLSPWNLGVPEGGGGGGPQ